MFKWLKENITKILGSIIAIAVGLFFWNRHKDKVGSLKDALAVKEAVSEVKKLKATRSAIKEQKLFHRIVKNKIIQREEKIKKEAATKLKNVEKMKPSELSKAFTDLGF